ncbi:MAG: transposase [Thermoplasmata archaeon]
MIDSKKKYDKSIFFVMRIKSNVKYEIIKEYANTNIIKISNGLILRLVTINDEGKEYQYLTNIFDLPDEYIQDINGQRWNIEIFFRAMKNISSWSI